MDLLKVRESFTPSLLVLNVHGFSLLLFLYPYIWHLFSNPPRKTLYCKPCNNSAAQINKNSSSRCTEEMASNLISAAILEKQLIQKGYCTHKEWVTQINLFYSDLVTVIRMVKHYQVNTDGQVPGAFTFHKVFSQTKVENKNGIRPFFLPRTMWLLFSLPPVQVLEKNYSRTSSCILDLQGVIVLFL